MLLLPLMFGMLGTQLVTGRLISANGRYRIYPILGGTLMTAGAPALLLLDGDTPTALASALTLPIGAGIGLVMQSTTLITMNSADPRDMGAANGTLTLARTIGGSLGIALLGSLYAARMRDGLAARLGPAEADRLTTGGELTPALLPGLPEQTADAVRLAVTDGLHVMLLGAVLLGAAVFALSWLVRETPLSMRAWVERLHAFAGEDGLWAGRFQFGDWLDPAAPPDAPGYRQMEVRPLPGYGLTWAEADLETPYGNAGVAWRISGGTLILEARVPPGTEAIVHLPGREPFRAGPGHHQWKAELPPPASPEVIADAVDDARLGERLTRVMTAHGVIGDPAALAARGLRLPLSELASVVVPRATPEQVARLQSALEEQLRP
ncbi:alpha-L-rhamnosidase C-terminal domain-containing protein [Nonomuraea sp. NPDC052265]|uniref:alpha-L-rhamnosidase C-terminal domain-containing protein n=1 Tax=Nonomuraea sp. NPDC052265 TaxID=3364374 RepID=UPI0037CB5E2C